MVTTYILTIEDFKNRADISPQIATNIIKQHVGVTQEKYAVKILCNNLYNEVLDHVSGANTSTAIATLLPYLKDYLIYKAYARYLLYANTHSTAAGVRVVQEPVSSAISDKMTGELIAEAKDNANFYQDQLVNFLVINEDDYQSWKDSICNCGNRRAYRLNKMSTIGGGKRPNDPVIKWS